MKRIGKRMKKAYEPIKRDKLYTLDEALSYLEAAPKPKFDETVELHFHLAIDTKASEQTIRGTVSLPHGLGKEVKVAVFCKGEMEKKAQAAGADHVGHEDLIKKVAGGFLDFDVVIASPDMMRDISKLGKVLGPRGLMPTPKAGTVTTDIEKAIKEVKAGKIEFKSDKQAGIHVGIGKRSFDKQKLRDNINHIIEAINHAKPTSVKGSLIKGLSLSSSMGPGLKVML